MAPIMNRSCQANGLKNQPSPVQAGRLMPVMRTATYTEADKASSSTGLRSSGNASAKISSSTT